MTEKSNYDPATVELAQRMGCAIQECYKHKETNWHNIKKLLQSIKSEIQGKKSTKRLKQEAESGSSPTSKIQAFLDNLLAKASFEKFEGFLKDQELFNDFREESLQNKIDFIEMLKEYEDFNQDWKSAIFINSYHLHNILSLAIQDVCHSQNSVQKNNKLVKLIDDIIRCLDQLNQDAIQVNQDKFFKKEISPAISTIFGEEMLVDVFLGKASHAKIFSKFELHGDVYVKGLVGLAQYRIKIAQTLLNFGKADES